MKATIKLYKTRHGVGVEVHGTDDHTYGYVERNASEREMFEHLRDTFFTPEQIAAVYTDAGSVVKELA